jgi:hypothetical protein
MFDTLLLRPSLHCNTPLHFTQLHFAALHPATLNYTYQLFYTSLPLIYTSLPFHLALSIYISYSISHHITRHSTDLIPKIISKIINLFTALKNFSTFHFTSLFILFIYLFTYPINPTLHFTLLFLTTTHFPLPHFPSLLLFIVFTFPHWFTLS